MPFSYPVFGEGLLVSYYYIRYGLHHLGDLSIVEVDDVRVRLALIVVLDLSSPRGGLGSRIAWGLPWGDFSFPCSGGICLLRPVQRERNSCVSGL